MTDKRSTDTPIGDTIVDAGSFHVWEPGGPPGYNGNQQIDWLRNHRGPAGNFTSKTADEWRQEYELNRARRDTPNEPVKLTAEQELQLVARRDAGDDSAVEELAMANLALVFRITRQLEIPDSDSRFDDLIRVGMDALWRAAELFRGTNTDGESARFVTYATRSLRPEMLRWIQEQREFVVNVGEDALLVIADERGRELQMRYDTSAIYRALNDLTRLDRDVIELSVLDGDQRTNLEVAKFLGIGEDQIAEAFKHMRVALQRQDLRDQVVTAGSVCEFVDLDGGRCENDAIQLWHSAEGLSGLCWFHLDRERRNGTFIEIIDDGSLIAERRASPDEIAAAREARCETLAKSPLFGTELLDERILLFDYSLDRDPGANAKTVRSRYPRVSAAADEIYLFAQAYLSDRFGMTLSTEAAIAYDHNARWLRRIWGDMLEGTRGKRTQADIKRHEIELAKGRPLTICVGGDATIERKGVNLVVPVRRFECRTVFEDFPFWARVPISTGARRTLERIVVAGRPTRSQSTRPTSRTSKPVSSPNSAVHPPAPLDG